MSEDIPYFQTLPYLEMLMMLTAKSDPQNNEVRFELDSPRTGLQLHPVDNIAQTYIFRYKNFFNTYDIAALCSIFRTHDGKHLPTYPKDDDPTARVYRINKGNWGFCQCVEVETFKPLVDAKFGFNNAVKHTDKCAKKYYEVDVITTIKPFDRNAEQSPTRKEYIAQQRSNVASYKNSKDGQLYYKQRPLSQRLRIYPIDASTDYFIVDPDSPIKVYNVIYDNRMVNYIVDIENFVMNLYDLDYVDYLLPRDADYRDYIVKK